jgi:hypothetical protein
MVLPVSDTRETAYSFLLSWFVARRSIQLSYGRTVNKYYHSLALPIQPPPTKTISVTVSTRRDPLFGCDQSIFVQATLSRPAPSAPRTKLLPCASLPSQSSRASVSIVTTSKPANAH